MVPWLPWRQFIKRLFREDIFEGVIISGNCIIKLLLWLFFKSLLCKSLRHIFGGIDFLPGLKESHKHSVSIFPVDFFLLFIMQEFGKSCSSESFLFSPISLPFLLFFLNLKMTF